jgi:glycosyltransferase involved in cell wall biosynthesis
MTSLYSAVIIAKNEASTIGQCITALKKITNDIIIVLDDQSEDNTESIAVGLGAKVLKKKWEGYSSGKNYGISFASADWIICVDADEIITDELSKNLNELTPNESCVYDMNIRTWFGSHPVRFCGWFPDWNIRLFNKNVMRWNDNFVHEKLISDRKLTHCKINGIVEHYSFRDEAHMGIKFDYYARLRAGEWARSGKTPSVFKQWFGPYFRFFRTYVLKLGFLDGKTGFLIAKNEYLLKQKELYYWKTG